MPDSSDKISYRIDEAVKASGLGRSFLYEKMGEGLLRSVKIGGRRLILRSDLLEFINGGKSALPALPSPAKSGKTPEADVPGKWQQLELPWQDRK